MNWHYTPDRETFTNPYNFVPLDKKCNKDIDITEIRKDIMDNGGLSGTIHCKLETLTPLFIPNTTTNRAFPFTNTVYDRNRRRPTTSTGNAYDFFSYEDLSGVANCTGRYARPIVPGSSLRGALRSAFEAATNGCLSTCNDESLVLHRRTTKPKEYYGILEKTSTGYVLHEAEKVMLNTAVYHGKSHAYGINVNRSGNTANIEGHSKKTGDAVFIEKETNVFITSQGFRTRMRGVKDISPVKTANCNIIGLLFLGEKFQNKHHDAVFIKKGGTSRTITEDDFERFVKVWQQYQADAGDSLPKPYPNYITLSEIPVYYSIVDPGGINEKKYIVPACVSKEVFDAKLSKLLGDHDPCTTTKNKICPACALFGMISEDADGSLASRVMFHDATPIGYDDKAGGDFFEQPQQLPILESPKISATEFYTDDYSKNYRIWNYDYGIRVEDGKPEGFSPKLRGRKFYWHKKSLTQFGEKDRADLTAKIRAVKKGREFDFKISFDRLTSKELHTLLWVLTFGDEPGQAHKLGHGKPVGYGSVRYAVKSVELCNLHDDLTFSKVERNPDYTEATLVAKNAISQYRKLTNYYNAPDNVMYPLGVSNHGDKSIFQWFSSNKWNMNNPEFEQVLAYPDNIMRANKASTASTAPIGDKNKDILSRFFEDEKPEQSEQAEQPKIIKRIDFDRNKLKRDRKNYKNNKFAPKSKYLLKFVKEYETNPELYKDFEDFYNSL